MQLRGSARSCRQQRIKVFATLRWLLRAAGRAIVLPGLGNNAGRCLGTGGIAALGAFQLWGNEAAQLEHRQADSVLAQHG
jgi:hypothetical protein